MRNPFVTATPLSIPMRLDVCQQIHYTALRLATCRVSSIAIPDSVPLAQLRQAARSHGSAVYLLHPADIERSFSGVTTAVYQTIEELYGDRLERSTRMVWRILDVMARQAGKPSVSYEAVWAICLYLDERRQASLDVTLNRTEAIWQIAQITPDARIQDTPKPVIVCVLDTDLPRVLAFRIANSEAMGESVSLAVYDAIASQRRPSRDGGAGLAWRLPVCIETTLDLPQDCQRACARVGISVEQAKTTSGLLDALHGEWAQDLAGRLLAQDHFMAIFDNYLEKIHGYGPIRAREELTYEFANLVGFNRDPAWQFPALRDFLPPYPSVVHKDGTVEYDGLHYEDPLLTHWPGREVVLRRSESAEAVAWVYLYGEILCQAVARELRRQDGGYRPSRPRR